ncbi:MAG: hypothetical protein JXR88_17685 [Clostridia bacterium]|nr:hypothetical protein [Clostridia bacterium]
MRYYFLTIVNLMTYYHRIDDFEKIDLLYKESLKIFDEEFSINNLAYYMIRTGLNKSYLKDFYGDNFVNVGLALLRDGNYEAKYNKHLETFTKKYPFLNLKSILSKNDIE